MYVSTYNCIKKIQLQLNDALATSIKRYHAPIKVSIHPLHFHLTKSNIAGFKNVC